VDLSQADLWGADLWGADLSQAKLSQADLWEADLSRADLSEADLWEADLSRANLSEADLSGADLSQAKFIRADLSRAYVRGADLSGALINSTSFGGVDLSEVKGLDTVEHIGPSTIGIDTLYNSKGRIPEAFLRGAGVPEVFITYLPSLTEQPIQYYSCFISYSNQDENFAKRLHTDLQQEGVRCWFAPEDLKIGERIRVGIDQAIRVHEKLLLILSEHSVASDWVEQEVETAMEQERERNETVLFPLRIDESIMREKKGWAAHIKRTRNIGDFSQWEEHQAYQKGFQRLLRDLKMEQE
jgi:uncharacterized protein YjbI with pentapeptide repeats